MKSRVLQLIGVALEGMGVPGDYAYDVEIPRDPSNGDLSTPAAMGLARALRKAPRQIAEDLRARLLEAAAPGEFDAIDIAGPGFINFRYSPASLHAMLGPIVRGHIERMDVGRGMRVQVEFVSANPTGPLHLGHGRGAAVGAALSNVLLASGFDVTREYYINDAGRQVELLAESAYARYMGLQGAGHPIPEDGYRGEYVVDIARAALDERGAMFRETGYDDEARAYFRDLSLRLMMEAIGRDLRDFGVEFDVWQSERELYEGGAVASAIEFLKGRDSAYEKDGALWFRAERFGDEKDRVIIKGDGAHTYFASDIAYHLKKVRAGYREIINVWGADHHGYIPRLEAVLEALGHSRERLKVLLIQMVSLERGGKPVQMSKRTGDFVTLSEVCQEVGADIAKFIFLTRRHDSHLTFDLDLARASSSENPVFYVQYAGARINSIFKKAKEEGFCASMDDEAVLGAVLGPLAEAEELALTKKLLSYPMALEAAARSREPHRLTFYLQELAGQFHPYYNRHRVLVEDRALAMARLALCRAVSVVLRDGLRLLGLTAPEKM